MQPGARDWPHSSFHRDVRAGIFPEDWAADVGAGGEFGERSGCGCEWNFGAAKMKMADYNPPYALSP
jgi:hypothetical protein